MQDGKLRNFEPIEAAFILSGVESDSVLQRYLGWYQKLLETIRGFHFDAFDQVATARKLFNYLRTTIYGEYKIESTTLRDIVDKKQYNCVSATILYNLICEEIGIRTEAFETPTHVYTIFSEFGHEFIVENTHPMGFDILKNLNVYSKYLAQFYPENQVYEVGLDRLYAFENSKGRRIDNTELLGLLAYNQAYFAERRGDYAEAYRMILLAQDFNNDSRSNVNLEMELYFKWGKQCFDESRFYEAFEVLADGTWRYPKEKALAQNTRAAFFNVLNQNWAHRDWEGSRQIMGEMHELGILDPGDLANLRNRLQNWMHEAIRIGNKRMGKQVESELRRLSKIRQK